VVARAEAAAVEVRPEEVGEVVDQVVGLGREEEAEVVGTTTTTTSMEVPDAVQGVVVVVVAELGGDEEVHHLHHPLGRLPPQTPCWTRTFSLVSSFSPSVSQV